MADTGQRQLLAQLGEERGWNRRISDGRADIYMKGTVRIRVVWAGDQDLSGASLFHDQWYESYTRDPSTVSAWLKR
ncbi:MAG: hypothetical protein WCH82_05565 [Mycobacteriaceae bacterium]